VSDLFNTETGWLSLTNVVLGLAVLVCLVAVGRTAIQEMRAWATKRARATFAKDDHVFSLESLGITMADGGERLNEMGKHAQQASDHPDDTPNVTRSDN